MHYGCAMGGLVTNNYQMRYRSHCVPAPPAHPSGCCQASRHPLQHDRTRIPVSLNAPSAPFHVPKPRTTSLESGLSDHCGGLLGRAAAHILARQTHFLLQAYAAQTCRKTSPQPHSPKRPTQYRTNCPHFQRNAERLTCGGDANHTPAFPLFPPPGHHLPY